MDSLATVPIWTTISAVQGRIKSLKFGDSEDIVYAYCIEGLDKHFIHRIKACNSCHLDLNFFELSVGYKKAITG